MTFCLRDRLLLRPPEHPYEAPVVPGIGSVWTIGQKADDRKPMNQRGKHERCPQERGTKGIALAATVAMRGLLSKTNLRRKLTGPSPTVPIYCTSMIPVCSYRTILNSRKLGIDTAVIDAEMPTLLAGPDRLRGVLSRVSRREDASRGRCPC